MRLQNNTISILTSSTDLELSPASGANVALIGSPKITGLQDPTDMQDAATKEYVDNKVETRNLAFSIDLSDGKPNSYIINNILNNLAPPAEHRNGTIARVLCNFLINSTGTVALNPLVSLSSSVFNTPTGTANAVTNVAMSPATIPAAVISTSRIVKQFQLVVGAWTWVSDTILPG